MELDQQSVERIVGEDPALSIIKFPHPLFKDGFIICSIETRLLECNLTLKYTVPQSMLSRPVKHNSLIYMCKIPNPSNDSKLVKFLKGSPIVEFRAE
jgi:hypothetical protein